MFGRFLFMSLMAGDKLVFIKNSIYIYHVAHCCDMIWHASIMASKENLLQIIFWTGVLSLLDINAKHGFKIDASHLRFC